jgi:hypothetical protein
LARAIDYAGLFPPASLDLTDTLRNYSRYRSGADSWALGRLIVPAGRLAELPSHGNAPIELSVVIGPEDFRFLRSGAAGGYLIRALEIKGPPESDPGLTPIRYFETPLDDALEQRLPAIQAAGGLAKVRTGGTTGEAFPPSDRLTRFLVAAARLRLPFKATAGLHHPLRGSYRLTYESAAPSGVMYGYLNLAIAAILAWQQAGEPEVESALLESDRQAIRFHSDALQWRLHRFPTGILAQVRRDFFHGFGSCSFREPLDELGPLVPVS